MKAQEPVSLGKLMEYWPLIVAIGMGVTGYLKLNYEVAEYKDMADHWKSTSDAQKEKRNAEMEAIRSRLTVLETENRVRHLP